VHFHVRDLEVRPKAFDVEIPVGELQFSDVMVRQTGPLRAQGQAELVAGSLGEIRVRGHLSVTLEGECDRCLDPVALPVDSDLSLEYRPVADGYGDEKEVLKEEAEIGFYQGDGIDLADVLREFVLLSLPMQKICKDACKGICPLCGRNRNIDECQCKAPGGDDRWAALRERI